MHEELLKDPLIERCIGKLDGFAIYQAKPDFRPIDRGVTVYAPDISQEVWKKVVEELTTKEDRKDLPRNIFLHEFQVTRLMGWAEGLITPVDEEGLIDCGDCKGSGWYVGAFERYYCPTCDGAGKVVP